MFVRKNRNRSGSVSVQIISKKRGRYQVVDTVGCSKNPEKIEKLVLEAKNRICYPPNQPQLFSMLSETDLALRAFLEEMRNLQIRTVGPELIFGTLFDRIGFNKIPDELFRHLVIARLAYPTSKLKTVDYLYRYKSITVNIQALYRFLDKLSNQYQQKVEGIAFEYTKRMLKGSVSIVFYDLTTLYFEAEDEDDLRKMGFSKDSKFHKPQIMLGLLVGKNGYPISYDIFQGNIFEGHTLLPILRSIESKYGLNKPTIIADAALLSKDNLELLNQQGYQYIIGARLKNETEKLKQKILKQAQDLSGRES